LFTKWEGVHGSTRERKSVAGDNLAGRTHPDHAVAALVGNQDVAGLIELRAEE
jgi:hypothetical protein